MALIHRLCKSLILQYLSLRLAAVLQTRRRKTAPLKNEGCGTRRRGAGLADSFGATPFPRAARE